MFTIHYLIVAQPSTETLAAMERKIYFFATRFLCLPFVLPTYQLRELAINFPTGWWSIIISSQDNTTTGGARAPSGRARSVAAQFSCCGNIRFIKCELEGKGKLQEGQCSVVQINNKKVRGMQQKKLVLLHTFSIWVPLWEEGECRRAFNFVITSFMGVLSTCAPTGRAPMVHARRRWWCCPGLR